MIERDTKSLRGVKRALARSVAILLCVVLSACANSPERLYAEREITELGADSHGLADAAVSLAGAVQHGELAVLATVTEKRLLTEEERAYHSNAVFVYTVTVDAVYLDKAEAVAVGDVLSWVSGFGMMPCEEYRALFPEAAGTDAADTGWYALTRGGGLAVDVGYQYVLFLDADTLAQHGVYSDATWQQVYGLRDDVLFFGAKGDAYDGDLEGLVAEIKALA